MGRVVTIAGPTKKVPRQFVCLEAYIFPKHFHPDPMLIGLKKIHQSFLPTTSKIAPQPIQIPKSLKDCSDQNVDVDGEKRKIWCWKKSKKIRKVMLISIFLQRVMLIFWTWTNMIILIMNMWLTCGWLSPECSNPLSQSSILLLVLSRELGNGMSVTICDTIYRWNSC